ncbi:MAG: sodium-dependent transporter [Gemmatimonadota bacterium]|nr:MAG: sodium-dependent transporter [Gemmatimonadota bacterium]
MEAQSREAWGTKLGFILAAVGSAVGLGNMWRFPYAVSDKGGAAFVILYIVMVIVVGVPIMLSEFAVGRRARLSPIGALRETGGPRWMTLGYLYVLTGVVILAYYSVIAGWAMRYTLEALLSGFSTEPGQYFERSSTGVGAALYHIVFMGITISIVVGGVKAGIERVSLVLMPVLFLLVVGLAIYAATLGGAGAGYSFYLRPRLGHFFSASTLAAAASQAFFSLSLGMGAMLTYASYLKRDENLPGSAAAISFSDFGVAFVGGLVVFPVIFAFGLQGEIGASPLGALFISVPRAFVEMGAAGRVVGLMFFTALLVGALTSAISLLEVVTSSLIDHWKLDRTRAALGAGLVILFVGLPCAYDLNVLGLFDAVAGEFFLGVGAFFLALLVGWRAPEVADEVRRGFSREALIRGWLWVVRVVVPIILAVVIYDRGKNVLQTIQSLIAGP